MGMAERLRAGEAVYTVWSAIPDPLIAEFLARGGFETVTLDMQHGCHSTDSVLRGVSAVMLAGKQAVVRVPVGRFDMASRALDFGASAVIAPMVNSLSDARAFAAAMKYPPLGERSWGPTRVLALRGATDPQAYLRAANLETLAIAMIETRAALAAVDDILGIDGIDGVFVGPSDFSIALSDGARVNALDETMLVSAGDVAARAQKAGKIAGIFTFTAEAARHARDLGFRFINISGDIGILTAGASALVSAARR